MLVTRNETEKLEEVFQKAFDKGKGSTIILTGESGIGKSFFVKDFIEKKVQRHKNNTMLKVISALSENDRRKTDLYAWKELIIDLETNLASLAIWSGKAESPEIDYKKLVRNVFDEQGPDWLKLIPVVGESATILLKAIKGIKKESEAQTKARELLKPNTNVIYNTEDDRFKHLMLKLRLLSETDIVILFIKDIQFFDDSSLDLFYKLSKNLSEDPYRLILIGSYCEEDITNEKFNPLTGRIEVQPIEIALDNLRKLKSYLEFDLKGFSINQIEDYLNLNFPGNDFSNNIKEDLEKITNGNPLFLDAVVKDLRENGIIFEVEGKFKNKVSFDYSNVPVNISETIENRYNHLDKDLKKIVNLASVMGDDFSSEVIMDILNEDISDFYLKTDVLKDEYEIIIEIEKSYLDLTLIYKFIHYLYQMYVYNKLTNNKVNIKLHKSVSESLRKLLSGDKINCILEQYSYHIGVGNRIISEKGKVILKKENLIYEETLSVVKEFVDIYKKLIEGYEKTFSNDEAINKCRVIIELSELLDDKNLEFDYMMKMAFIVNLKDKLEAEKTYRKALVLSEELSDKCKIADCKMSLGNLMHDQSDYSESVNFLKDSLKISEELNDKIRIARVYVTFGNIYEKKEKHEESINSYEKALRVREELDDLKGIGIVKMNLGNVYYNTSDFEKSEEYYRKALDIYEELNDNYNIPKAIKNLGNIFFSKEEFDLAIEYYDKAHMLFKKTEDQKEIADVLVNQGVIYYNLNKVNESIAKYNEALIIYKYLGEKANKAKCLKNLGLSYFKKAEYDKSLDFLVEANSINERIEAKTESIICEFCIGEIFFEKNNIEQAFINYDKSINEIRKLNSTGYLSSFLFRKANSLFKLNKFSESEKINIESKELALLCNREDIVFKTCLLSIKILSKTDAQKSLGNLKEMLNNFTSDEETAELHFEFYKLTGDNEKKLTSIELYEKLNIESPLPEYQRKLDELNSI